MSGNKQIGRAAHRIGETEMPRNRHLLAAVIGVLITVSAGGGALAQESGGILRVYSADSPPGLNIYEQATPWGQGPLMAVYNNLILFDQHDPQIRLESIKPDLATKWEWNEGRRWAGANRLGAPGDLGPQHLTQTAHPRCNICDHVEIATARYGRVGCRTGRAGRPRGRSRQISTTAHLVTVLVDRGDKVRVGLSDLTW